MINQKEITERFRKVQEIKKLFFAELSALVFKKNAVIKLVLIKVDERKMAEVLNELKKL